MSEGTLTYLYCILPGGVQLQAGDLAGLEDQPVRVLPVAGLQAAVSQVGPEFGEATLNQRVRDLDWLSPRAVRHHEVVDQLYGQCRQLLPLTFGAIFESAANLQAKLARQAEPLEAALAKLAGKEEWDLKLVRDEATFRDGLRQHSHELRRLEDEARQLSPGRAFMVRKKIETLAGQEAQRVAIDVREQVYRSLSEHAAEARRDQIVAPAEPGAARLELRAAYLVDTPALAGLQAAAEELAARYSPLGYTLELTGPWPAFSFAGALREALA